MLACIPTNGDSGLGDSLSEHFGSAAYFTLYDSASGRVEILTNRTAHRHHGTCDPMHQLTAYDIDCVICSGMGRRAVDGLRSRGIRVLEAQSRNVGEVVRALSAGRLREMDPSRACHGHDSGGAPPYHVGDRGSEHGRQGSATCARHRQERTDPDMEITPVAQAEGRSGIILTPIGVIHTPFPALQGTPLQPDRSGDGPRGTIKVYPEYTTGLTDLDGFSHVILLYAFHLSKGYEVLVVPYGESSSHGLFATRCTMRPNPIGLSVVRLEEIRHNTLMVTGVDMVDGTPLLDIKPYVPEIDSADDVRTGWINRTD